MAAVKLPRLQHLDLDGNRLEQANPVVSYQMVGQELQSLPLLLSRLDLLGCGFTKAQVSWFLAGLRGQNQRELSKKVVEELKGWQPAYKYVSETGKFEFRGFRHGARLAGLAN